MKNKNIAFKNFEIKEYKADDNGNLVITGYGAVFGNIDSYGDVIEKGAFLKTIQERKGRIAFAYQHDIWNPIGKIQEIKEDDTGLWIKVMLSAADQDIQTKVKEGILSEMSIGYRTVSSNKGVIDEQEVNFLTEIKLFEISLVTIAANPLAVVNTMKGEEKKDHIEAQFDRAIALTRNENLKFELLTLKALCTQEPLDLELGKGTPKVKEPQLKSIIVFEDNLFTSEL